jgi:hypothetical protein
LYFSSSSVLIDSLYFENPAFGKPQTVIRDHGKENVPPGPLIPFGRHGAPMPTTLPAQWA